MLFETSTISFLSASVNLFLGSGLSTRGRWSYLTVPSFDHRWLVLCDILNSSQALIFLQPFACASSISSTAFFAI
ncbi:hypothetical protein LJ207_12120 [Halanaerobium sp. Z-7514]|uniref:Secreted protein n=1 Tax=Halanaerobium polyolivorans TaxID=2886943 RepID=A0AAW4X2N1_9FIRM|nr:hypothetical protein [Halanaerobium polyolivorans]MCC3146057.1 hypothetical protein [Halanaerobium polyolivorans]